MAWADTVYGAGEGSSKAEHLDGYDCITSHPEDVGSNPAPVPTHDEPLPEIPPMFRAEPAVLEAGRIIKGCSIAHFIPDGRVVR